MSHYRTKIAAILADAGRETTPLFVEAWMRSEHGTLDALSPGEFHALVLLLADVADGHPSDSAALADCMGLR